MGQTQLWATGHFLITLNTEKSEWFLKQNYFISTSSNLTSETELVHTSATHFCNRPIASSLVISVTKKHINTMAAKNEESLFYTGLHLQDDVTEQTDMVIFPMGSNFIKVIKSRDD